MYTIQGYEEKFLEKRENGILPSNMLSTGQTFLKKQRNSKVSPEDALEKPQIPRKPINLGKSAQKSIPKPKPLSRSAYINNVPFVPKVYGPEPFQFLNETIPFVPLETSEPPPSTLQQQTVDELKAEKTENLDNVSEGNGNEESEQSDEDQISVDHLTNHIFETDDKMVITDNDTQDRMSISKFEDRQDSFMGRINFPVEPAKSGGNESEKGQKLVPKKARKQMKTTRSAYAPMHGNKKRVIKV